MPIALRSGKARQGHVVHTHPSSRRAEMPNGTLKHFNGNSWVATVQRDIPFVASKGSVHEASRIDAAADAKKKRRDAETAGKIVAACFGIGL